MSALPLICKSTKDVYTVLFTGSTTLDSISLLVGSSDCFHQQILSTERIEPTSTHILVEGNDFLLSPGRELTRRVSFMPSKNVAKYINGYPYYLEAIDFILDGVVNPTKHKFPRLCERWVTALHWYAEGCRELHDFIAIPKLATSLDVLCRAGGQKPITEMLTNLLKIKPNGKKEHSVVIAKIVEEIYGEGRSKILHGLASYKFKELAQPIMLMAL